MKCKIRLERSKKKDRLGFFFPFFRLEYLFCLVLLNSLWPKNYKINSYYVTRFNDSFCTNLATYTCLCLNIGSTFYFRRHVHVYTWYFGYDTCLCKWVQQRAFAPRLIELTIYQKIRKSGLPVAFLFCSNSR